MRTTIDLPDELFRQVKARAALEGRKLKDLIASFVAEGLERGSPPENGRRRRSQLPVVGAATSGVPIPALSGEEIARIEEEEDLARLARPPRR
jgi:hypothetical protein